MTPGAGQRRGQGTSNHPRTELQTTTRRPNRSGRAMPLDACQAGNARTGYRDGRKSLVHRFLFRGPRRHTDVRGVQAVSGHQGAERGRWTGSRIRCQRSALHYWTAADMQSHAEKTAQPTTTAEQSFRQLETDIADSVGAFFNEVERRLKAGEVRIIFFLEQAPVELKRLVEFMNKHVDTVEVLLVEGTPNMPATVLKSRVTDIVRFHRANTRHKKGCFSSASTETRCD